MEYKQKIFFVSVQEKEISAGVYFLQQSRMWQLINWRFYFYGLLNVVYEFFVGHEVATDDYCSGVWDYTSRWKNGKGFSIY